MYTSLLYNVNVASSITAQGRAFVSTMTLCFEQFLNNNVKFGSLNEVMVFINNVVQEGKIRHYDDRQVLNKENQFITPEDCFVKIVLTCGYRWVPNNDELDVIWRTICNLDNEDRTRLYYKNNLFEFMTNSVPFNIVRNILKKLDNPIMTPDKIPDEVKNDIKVLTDLLKEYVYYRYMIIDRIDRCTNMIKSVTMVSDTDSTIISLDGWYRFMVERINGDTFKIANDIIDPLLEEGDNEIKTEKVLEYDFNTDSIIEIERMSKPEIQLGNENIKYTIINIMAHVLDNLVNDYMEQACKAGFSLMVLEDDWEKQLPKHMVSPRINLNYVLNNLDRDLPYDIVKEHSYNHKCKIYAKNEFYFKRLMMTTHKKNYASLIGIQEGNLVPEDKELDIKGIESLSKSTMPIQTRKALQKILLEDILKAPVIDQLKFVKDMALLEKQITQSILDGSKDYFKPATIKSASSYDDPMRIQGIKASIAWNSIKTSDYPGIDLNERNAINIAKVDINIDNVEKIKDKYPEIYENIKVLLLSDDFGYTIKKLKSGDKVVYGTINAIAIPMDQPVPEWIREFVDYTTIINDNIGGFPYESIGIQRLNKSNINYTNILKL